MLILRLKLLKMKKKIKWEGFSTWVCSYRKIVAWPLGGYCFLLFIRVPLIINFWVAGYWCSLHFPEALSQQLSSPPRRWLPDSLPLECAFNRNTLKRNQIVLELILNTVFCNICIFVIFTLWNYLVAKHIGFDLF